MKFTIGNTLNEGFGLISHHFASIATAALLIYALPMVGGSIALFQWTGFNLQNPENMFTDGDYGPFGIYMLLSLVAGYITLSVITEIVVKGEARQPFNLGAAIGRGFLNIIPLIIIGILYGIMTAIGFILLIIPGFIVMLAFYVAMTAYVAEPGIGIIGALKRSRALTKGHRWAILAIILIIGIVGGIAASIISLPLTLMATGLPPMVSVGLQMLISSLTSMVSFVFMIAIYICLRRSKETHTPENVAQVFA